jgi:hypothetical protein
MLHNLQNSFLDHLFGKSGGIAAHISQGGPFTPQQRMQVYKNNTQLILTDILLQTFPAVTKLVDEKFMRFAAHEFISQHPPASGDMNDYGADFPDFLKKFPALAGHPYVAAAAALEWAWQESYLSPVNPSPSSGAQQLSLQPHVRLLSSAWPVVDIWRYALEGGVTPDMTPGEYFVLTCRDQNSVDVWRLEKPAFMFLQTLDVETAQPDFDAEDFLSACFKGGIFQEAPS